MTRYDWEDGQYRKDIKPLDPNHPLVRRCIDKPVMSLAGLVVALAVSGAFWGLLLWALWPE